MKGKLWDLEASMSGCWDVFIRLPHSKCSAGLLGRADRFAARAHHDSYVFLSVYVLLNLFFSSAWDWTLDERWLAGRQEGGKVSFQHFIVACSALASPLPPQTQLLFGNTQGNYSLCLAFCMLPGCWSYLSSSLKCVGIGCPLENHRLSLFWSNATTYTKIITLFI